MKKKVGNLVIDEKLVEFRPINTYFVSQYRQAMRVGAVFPPVIVEKETNRIVSGNHRVTSYMEEYGPDHKIEATIQEFQDEAHVIRTFAEENSRHGNPLSGWSQKSIIQKLLEYGDDPEVIAKALNIPVRKVQKRGEMNVVVIGKNKKKERKPIKHGLEHEAGSTVKQEMYETHKKQDRGIPAGSQADQLTRWIENGWINTSSENTMSSLWDLYVMLGRLFENRATG